MSLCMLFCQSGVDAPLVTVEVHLIMDFLVSIVSLPELAVRKQRSGEGRC